jgi:hypothetical protein
MRKTSFFALAVYFIVAATLMNGQRPSSRNSDEAAIRTDNALRRVNQGLQTIWSDPGTTIREKVAIMHEIHERMATTMLAMGEPAPAPLPEPPLQKPKRREDPPRI